MEEKKGVFKRRRVYAPKKKKKKANRFQLAGLPMGATEVQHFQGYQTFAMSGAGTMVHLTNIDGGSGRNQRDGAAIFIKNIVLRIYGYNDPNAAARNVNRFIVIRDNMYNADFSKPVIADVLAGSAVYSHVVDENRRRFTILKEFACVFDYYGDHFYWGKHYLPINAPCRWLADDGDEVCEGNLYCLCLDQDGTYHGTFYVDFDVAYTDK